MSSVFSQALTAQLKADNQITASQRLADVCRDTIVHLSNSETLVSSEPIPAILPDSPEAIPVLPDGPEAILVNHPPL